MLLQVQTHTVVLALTTAGEEILVAIATKFRTLSIGLYLRFTTYSEILAAWMMHVSSHPDHIGHPFF